MKKINNFANNKITIFVVLIILLLFWWGASLTKNPKISFSVINYPSELKDQRGQLSNGKKISGEFTAKDNHLGILYLRFDNFAMEKDRFDDLINFKIKEKNQKDWYYSNNYKKGLIQKLPLFPFGFPLIDNSKNRTYVFEIQSLSKEDKEIIKLSKNRTLLTSHQYSNQEIFDNKTKLVSFVIKKSIVSLINIDFLLSSLIFTLPLILYLLWLVVLRKHIRYYHTPSILIPTLIVILSILINPFSNGLLLIFMFLSLYILKDNKNGSKIFFSIFFILFILWAILNLININSYTDKISMCAYLFLLLGTAKSILEEVKK